MASGFTTVFAHAVNGGTTNATALATPGSDIPYTGSRLRTALTGFLAEFKTMNSILKEILSTHTTLSDEFRTRISTLMSGSGRMSCEWEYTGDTAKELPHYLLELALSH